MENHLRTVVLTLISEPGITGYTKVVVVHATNGFALPGYLFERVTAPASQRIQGGIDLSSLLEQGALGCLSMISNLGIALEFRRNSSGALR
jgi:hypothetical protein